MTHSVDDPHRQPSCSNGDAVTVATVLVQCRQQQLAE